MENIKKLNEQLEQYLEDEIEWRYEKICDVELISKNEDVFNELLITNIDMYGQLDLKEAVDTMAELYHEGKLRVAIPTNTKFKYKDKEYHLYIVMGDTIYERKQILCKYGLKHILDKHSKENSEIETTTLIPEKRILNAIKDIEKAIDNGTAFVDKRDNTKLVIHYNGLLYVICISTNSQEITYLNTLFKPDKDYVKSTLKNRYRKININK